MSQKSASATGEEYTVMTGSVTGKYTGQPVVLLWVTASTPRGAETL